MKSIVEVIAVRNSHWVGDGFPVRSLFSYQSHGESMSPFLLLDHAGPAEFPPTEARRGVGPHPHRGFETVTIVYEGEVAHRDTAGHGGTIGPGDVQWMTAGAGLLHEEYHGDNYRRTGGPFEMVQLWVNLPAEHKMTPPRYQGILSTQVPSVALPDEAGEARIIAGDYDGRTGPAKTFTPMQVWDVRLRTGARFAFPLPEGWGAGIVVLRGTVQINEDAVARASEMVVLGREGKEVRLEANNEVRLLVLSGEPIDEPLVGHGPFVMNTVEEIQEAIRDFNSGGFGSFQ